MLSCSESPHTMKEMLAVINVKLHLTGNKPLGRLQKPAGAEMEDRLSSPTLSSSSLSLREWRQRCFRSLGARKALGSKFSLGNLTIFWDLIQRPFTNWKRFRWTIWLTEHMSVIQKTRCWGLHTHTNKHPEVHHWPELVAASRGPASWWLTDASCTWSSSRVHPRPALPRWWRPSNSCPSWWARPGPVGTAPHCSAPLHSVGRPQLSGCIYTRGEQLLITGVQTLRKQLLVSLQFKRKFERRPSNAVIFTFSFWIRRTCWGASVTQDCFFQQYMYVFSTNK